MDMVKASLSTVNALFFPSLYPKRMTTSYLIRRGETAKQLSKHIERHMVCSRLIFQ